jgi:hypothetical protein
VRRWRRIREPIVRRRRRLYVVKAVDVEIKPDPSEAERAAILAALTQEEAENTVSIRKDEEEEE